MMNSGGEESGVENSTSWKLDNASVGIVGVVTC